MVEGTSENSSDLDTGRRRPELLDTGRRPELKSDEFLVVTAMVIEIISILVEIARR